MQVNDNTLLATNTVLSGIGIALGVSDISAVLGLVLTVLNIVVLLVSFGIRIYSRIKSKDLDGAVKEAEELRRQLEEMKEANKDGNAHNG